jgi:hypothetical protein
MAKVAGQMNSLLSKQSVPSKYQGVASTVLYSGTRIGKAIWQHSFINIFGKGEQNRTRNFQSSRRDRSSWGFILVRQGRVLRLPYGNAFVEAKA